jgi:putative ABC transport system permease protein
MLRNYLIVAWKVLLRRKFFTFASLFGVGITLMVLLVAVAMLDNIFAPQEPEVNGGRMLGVYAVSMSGERMRTTSPPGYGFLDRYIRPLRSLPNVEALSIISVPDQIVSYDHGRKISGLVRHTDGAFWRIMRFRFLEGGPFTDSDEAQGNFVAVINESSRRRYFNGGEALGKSVEVDGQTFRVVGVVKDVPIVRISSTSDVWVPTSTAKSSAFKGQFTGGFMALVLAHSPADFPAIRAEVAARAREAAKNLPDPKNYQEFAAGADTFFESIAREVFSGDYRQSQANRLRALLAGLAVLFMILPTVNLVNINLSRILDRASEIGVRKAFGASSWTLVGQFVVENLVLTLLGGLVGLSLAALVLAVVNASGAIAYAHFGLNLRVFAWGLGIALFFGLFSGVYPAWRMSKLHPVQALKGGAA